MRKDVKLGFAVGGVLIAVLVVYVLVVSSPPEQRTQLTSASGDAHRSVDVTSPGKPADATASDRTQKDATSAAPDIAKATLPSPPSGQAKDPFANDSPQPRADAGKGDLDWGKLLNGEQQPIPLMTQTPVSNKSASPAVAEKPIEPAPVVTNTSQQQPLSEIATNSTVALPDSLSSGPSTRPAGTVSGGPRTHIVQKNETLSSIAAAAYGNPSLYPHILRANPGLDPKRLKPGMTINLPEISDQRVDSSAAMTVSSSTPLDLSKQYKVQPGDSLHKISVNLYGKAQMADRIYELNKQLIGPDPAKLKVGQVLALPEPPTVASAGSH